MKCFDNTGSDAIGNPTGIETDELLGSSWEEIQRPAQGELMPEKMRAIRVAWRIENG